MYGKDRAFTSLLKRFLESALETELEAHLDAEQRKNGNRRNGQSTKLLKTAEGSFELSTPRDRNSDFELQIVRKRETILAESLEKKIIGMYGLGMSLRDISEHLKEMYDTEISATTLSQITDKIIPKAIKWQSNTLLPYKNSIKTITRDNGAEFAEHQYISQKLGCDFYFAHPYSL